ncbi:MAG: hypothetical protein ACOCVC_04745 [Spirochaeta sp.]
MKNIVIIGLTVLVLTAITSCNLINGDVPELQVLVRPNPEETASDMASGSEIYFGKPGDGVDEDFEFIIRNTGTADLILEEDGPDYVAIVDQNEAETPFSVLTGAAVKTIVPGEQLTVTIRFTGQSNSTRYAAKLLISSNDKEHPDYYLDLVGDGDGV